MVTNDTKMCLKCKSDREKGKYISKMKGFEIQAREIRPPPPPPTKKASKMTVLSDCENIFQKINIRPILNKLKLDC